MSEFDVFSADVKAKSKGSFLAMGFDKDVMKGLNRMGYINPTPVQRKALPVVLAGVDVVCMARTGSGKTGVFLLPLVHKLKNHAPDCGVRAIILSPTRELAIQTFRFAKDVAKFTDLKIVSIVGGDSIEAQFESLATKPDIIVATPGRLMHHIREINTFKLKGVKYLVFDEADRIFEMGFAEQLNEIVRECPVERQTLLFSATMPKQLVQFSRAGLRDPQLIRLDTDTKMSEELRLAFFSVRSNEKLAGLLYLIRRIIPSDQLTIVFTATKHHSEFLHALLQRIGVSSAVIYGSMDQDARSENLRMFRNAEVKYLIVTDVAARGIDIPLLNNVINFHFPSAPKLFVHRCGRAARQGRIGFALSLVEPEELAYMVDVHKLLGLEVETGHTPSSGDDDTSPQASGLEPYDLVSMTPSMIHTGLLPQDALDQENEFVKRALQDDDTLQNLFRISENGIKQYRRTRSEATKEGVKGAKMLTKSTAIKHIHPLIAGVDPSQCTSGVVQKADFVRVLQTYRPAQTVFETGIGTGTASVAVKNKSRAGSAESKGVEIMKAMRRSSVTALERNKKHFQAVEPLLSSEEQAGEEVYESSEQVDELGANESDLFEEDSDSLSITDSGNSSGKVRLSAAQKKRAKKRGLSATAIRMEEPSASHNTATKKGKLGQFRDSRFFMTYGDEDEKANFSEEQLQPQSGLRSTEANSAFMLENAILDLTPEDAMEMNKKKRLLRWDAKKKKFVKQTLEEMASSNSSSKKRVRTETGALIKGSARPQGEMYENWKKKSKREISMPGTGSEVDFRAGPNVKVNTHLRDELRDATAIRRLKDKKDDGKLKNMSKDKRKQILGKAKKGKDWVSAKVQRSQMNGPNRKMKAIIRY